MIRALKEKARRQIKKRPTLLKICKKARVIMIGQNLTDSLEIISTVKAIMLTEKLTEKIPNEFDVIIGIPRAGLLIATVIATKFGRPLTTVDNFLRGEVWYSIDAPKINSFKKALVVDDTVCSGKRLRPALKRLREHNPQLKIKVASLFIPFNSEYAEKTVSYYYVKQGYPHVFEWNLLTYNWPWGTFMDMDGVLCEDCSLENDDDGPHYVNWLEKAKPRLVPTYPLEAVITSRLEKYRAATAKWLAQHRVRYKRLIMLQAESKTERTSEAVVNFKVGALRALNAKWYWESNLTEATEISRKAGIPVLCTQNMTILTVRKSQIYTALRKLLM